MNDLEDHNSPWVDYVKEQHEKEYKKVSLLHAYLYCLLFLAILGLCCWNIY